MNTTLELVIAWTRRMMCLLVLAVIVSPLYAYPPAPPVTVYGLVRGEFGFRLDDGETDLVIFANGAEVARTAIRDKQSLIENYRLALAIDLNPASGAYRDDALSTDPSVSYRVVAQRGNLTIPVKEVHFLFADFRAEVGAVFRIDFVLGEDSDDDGLPDAWERFQVNAAGNPEGVDPLTVLSRDGNVDGDDMSDWEEYLAGTFATLFQHGLTIDLVNVSENGSAVLEFLAVGGKMYTLEVSLDGRNWLTIEFSTDNLAEQLGKVFRAVSTDRKTLRIEVPSRWDAGWLRELLRALPPDMLQSVLFALPPELIAQLPPGFPDNLPPSFLELLPSLSSIQFRLRAH